MTNSRRQAAFALMRWQATHDFASTLVPDGPDHAFVQDLVYTTIRRLRPLRAILGEFVRKWPKGELEALLYIGAAQILYLPSVPDFAAVHETVEAAKLSSNKRLASVVNGVLRNIIRQREAVEARLKAAPADVRESLPTALYRRWAARLGAEKAEQLAIWHNQPAETYLAYADRFEKLPRGQRVNEQPGFAEGAFIVQDPGTRFAIDLLAIEPGEQVLDCCAAPGGKTIQMVWRGAQVTACEVNPKRRQTLAANLARTHAEATILADIPDGTQWNKVLVDAPCSNTGVLRRRPDARWNWSEAKLAALVALQAQILNRAAALIAPGGTLVYSTCSNEYEENEGQVKAFLARHPDFACTDQFESIPIETGCDGAFAARFTRQAK